MVQQHSHNLVCFLARLSTSTLCMFLTESRGEYTDSQICFLLLTPLRTFHYCPHNPFPLFSIFRSHCHLSNYPPPPTYSSSRSLPISVAVFFPLLSSTVSVSSLFGDSFRSFLSTCHAHLNRPLTIFFWI